MQNVIISLSIIFQCCAKLYELQEDVYQDLL